MAHRWFDGETEYLADPDNLTRRFANGRVPGERETNDAFVREIARLAREVKDLKARALEAGITGILHERTRVRRALLEAIPVAGSPSPTQMRWVTVNTRESRAQTNQLCADQQWVSMVDLLATLNRICPEE